MGFRFQKRIKVAPGLRLNVSKRGLGVSAGPRGATISTGPRGTYVNTSLPGTGLSHRQKIGSTSRRASRAEGGDTDEVETISFIDGLGEIQGTWFGRRFVLVVLGALSMFFSPWLGATLLLTALVIHVVSLYDPKPVSARHFNNALHCLKYGEHQEALEELTQSLEKRPTNSLALAKLIVVLMDHFQDYERALPLIDKFIEATPDPALESLPPDPLLGTVFKANCLLELRRFDEVITLIQRSDTETWASPSVAEHLQLLLGRAFFENGSYEIAAEQLLKGPVRSRKRDDETVMEFRYWLGLAYLNSGEKRKAKTQLAKVYANDTDFRDISEYAREVGLI